MRPIGFEELRQRLSNRSTHRISKPDALQAAVALVLAPGAGAELELLLIKRSERDGDPWSGQMALPGGRRDPGDQNLLETARRETREETGIDLPAASVLGELDDLHPRTRVLPPITVRPFVFGLAASPPVRLSAEVALHLWVPLARLRGAGGRMELEVKGRRRLEQAYLLGSHIVWGMTHRILKPFMELAT